MRPEIEMELERRALMFAIKTLRSLRLLPTPIKAVKHGCAKVEYDAKEGEITRVLIHFNPNHAFVINTTITVEEKSATIEVFLAGSEENRISITRAWEGGQITSRASTSKHARLDVFVMRLLAAMAIESALYDLATCYVNSVVKAA